MDIGASVKHKGGNRSKITTVVVFLLTIPNAYIFAFLQRIKTLMMVVRYTRSTVIDE